MRESRCPGCGEIKYKQRSSDLCPDCKDLLKKGKKYDELLELKIEELNSGGYVKVWIPEAWCGAGIGDKGIDGLFREIAHLLSVDEIKSDRTYGRIKDHQLFGEHQHISKVYMKAAHVEILERFYDAIIKYIHEREKKAFERGKNQIIGLASGDIALNDIEKI